MEIASLDIVLYTALFLLPGFFMRNIIALLNPAKKTSDNIAFLSCLMYSIINLAIWSWAYVLATHLKNGLGIADWVYWVILVIITLVGATITSFAVGAFIQRRFVGWIGTKIHLNTIDPTDTAWDWLFAKREVCQMIITLKDDSEICGWYAERSFTSSNPDERDIYIQYTYKKDENGMYQPDPESKGIYIPRDLIKYIELKQQKEAEINGQSQ